MDDIQVFDKYEKSGISALHVAAGEGNATLAKQLLDNGANVNVLSAAGSCPLHIAASHGNCYLVRLLLENGADPNVADEDGMTALDNAAESGCETCQRLLLACSTRKQHRPRSSANVLESTVCEAEESACDTSEVSTLNGNIHSDNVLDKKVTGTAFAVQKHNGTDCTVAGNYSTTNANCVTTHTRVGHVICNGSKPNGLYTTQVPSAAAAWSVSASTAGSSLKVSDILSDDDESFNVADMVKWLNSTPQQAGEHEIDWASFLTDDVSNIADASTLIDLSQQQSQNNLPAERAVNGVNDNESTIICNVDDYKTAVADTAFISGAKCRALVNNKADRHKQLNTIVEVSSRFEKDLSVCDSNHAASFINGVDLHSECRLMPTPNTTFVSAVSSLASNVTCRSCGSSPAVRVTKHLDDDEEGEAVALVEAHLLPDSCQCHRDKQPTNKTIKQLTAVADVVSQSPQHSSALAIEDMSNVELHRQLVLLGEQPGPITLTTRKVYELRLRRLLHAASPMSPRPHFPTSSQPPPSSLPALQVVPPPAPSKTADVRDLIAANLDLSAMNILETEMCEHFASPGAAADVSRRGRSKTCFNYVLLDPRVTSNLPARARNMETKQAFVIFLQSVFYIGKGTSSRPFAHFKEAVEYRQKYVINQCQPGSKVWHILDIWNSGYGVVCLSVFHNAVTAEALTREACMISALGKSRLTNLRMGTCYGLVAQWPMDKQCQLGLFLLRKAFYIFLQEGERQIFPDEL